MDLAPARTESQLVGHEPSDAASGPSTTRAASRLVALQRRVLCLEERISLVQELETRMHALERDLMLSKSSVSGLSALQKVSQVNTLAQGVALQACLRVMLKKRVEARPEVLTRKRKRRAKVLTIEHVTTRDALEQLLALASVDAACTRGVGGRVSGRVVRCSGAAEVLSLIGCSAEEVASLRSKTFTRLSGSVSTRLLLETFFDEDGMTWFIIHRNLSNGTADVLQRPATRACRSPMAASEDVERKTVTVDELPGLSAEGPALVRWVAMGDPVQLASTKDGNVAGKLTVTLPVCVVEDNARDLQEYLEA